MKGISGKLVRFALAAVLAAGLCPAAAVASPDKAPASPAADAATVLPLSDGSDSASGFADVADDAWYATCVETAVKRGLFHGYSDADGNPTGCFGPDNLLSRAEALAVMYNRAGTLGLDVGGRGSFPDVQPGDWFYDAVCWGKAVGVTTGYNDGTFGPGDLVTREQLATMLLGFTDYCRGQGCSVMGAPSDEWQSALKDAGSASAWAYDGIGWANGIGAISGTGDGFLRPQGNATRAEASKILGIGSSAIMRDTMSDGVFDRGDLQGLVDDGTVDTEFESDGVTPAMIDGTFWAQPIADAAGMCDFLNSTSGLFGESLGADQSDVTVTRTSDDADADIILRYEPTVNGVPVIGSSIVVDSDSAGTAQGLFSTYDTGIGAVDTQAGISAADAVAAAEQSYRGDYSLDSSVPLLSQADLFVLPGDDGSSASLVYRVVISGPDTGGATPDAAADAPLLPCGGKTYYVAANSQSYAAGQVLSSFGNQQDDDFAPVRVDDIAAQDMLGATRTFTATSNGNGYDLWDPFRSIGTYRVAYSGWWIFRNPIYPGDLVSFNGTPDPDYVSAHANMACVYDYYRDKLGRRSYDGAGTPIRVSCRKEGVRNAYWDSDIMQFVFGDQGNYTAGLDTFGHEFTHAVIGSVVGGGSGLGLTYAGEPGALNESYADIMGSLIEGKDDEGRWLYGEDKGWTTRSLSNPGGYGQPDNYADYKNLPIDGDHDYGGVHANSGIFNHATYLMQTDGRCSPISKEQWAELYYISLFLLSPDSKFVNAREAILVTARRLGWTPKQIAAIKDAFDSAGITRPGGGRQVGDYVLFGKYEQDNNLENGPEDIEWRVLDEQNGKKLLVSRYALDCQRYNTAYAGVTWETCTLRVWLNGTFYDAAFSAADKARIASTWVANDDNPDYGTPGGNDTSDNVFCLSLAEVGKYFDSTYDDSLGAYPDRMCAPTPYAVAQGAWQWSGYTVDGVAACDWWLRSPGYYSSSAADVIGDGYVNSVGYYVDGSIGAVRPALWVNL
ncbi:MAG: DUF6273 domain-containing protein [Coriobacteriia bacterium]|nr:DUF6273 domain-containing protein [Coriobacteriia bacterium]